jgi:excisionase family DNA binding protein
MIVHGDSEKMLTVAEVTELIHIHPNTLRRWSEQGLITAYRINSRGDRRYKKSDIEHFLNEFNPYKNQDTLVSEDDSNN